VYSASPEAQADKLGAGNIRPVAADAETLDAEPWHFELAVIGNAFHRPDRDLVAARLLDRETRKSYSLDA
jgi:hypothetical protein